MTETKTGDAKVYFAGMPTQPDVDRLNARFGIPEEGALMRWEDIERACGLKRGTYRFHTVVSAWRRALYSKHNIVLGAEPGKGLLRLPPDGRIEHCKDRVSSGSRIIKRAVHVAVTTDRKRLTPENAHAADFYHRLGANMRLAEIASKKGVDLPNLEKS